MVPVDVAAWHWYSTTQAAYLGRGDLEGERYGDCSRGCGCLALVLPFVPLLYSNDLQVKKRNSIMFRQTVTSSTGTNTIAINVIFMEAQLLSPMPLPPRMLPSSSPLHLPLTFLHKPAHFFIISTTATPTRANQLPSHPQLLQTVWGQWCEMAPVGIHVGS